MKFGRAPIIPPREEAEVKFNILGMLIARKRGIPICQFVELYNAYCNRQDQALPRFFNGNPTAVKRLLYNQRDIVEIRMFHRKLYVFISDPVPSNFEEFRDAVLKNPINDSKVNGVPFAGPTKEESDIINIEDLMSFK